MKACIINWFWRVKVINMDHRPIGIIDSTQHKNHLFNQEILYLPSLVYVYFSLPKCNIWIVMQLLLQISLYLFYLISSKPFQRELNMTLNRNLPNCCLTLMLLTNNVKFILRGRSLYYIMKYRGPGMGPWGTPCFNVPQSKKKI